MSDDEKEDQKNLKPIRHPQLDFFIAEILDTAPLKSDRHSMEFPMFSLRKRPDTEEREFKYELGDGEYVEVRITPSSRGMATQDDKDFLIAAISQYMARLNRNMPASKTIRVRPKELLIATNRYTGGRDYQLMIDALERMDGTRIRTNIKVGGERTREGFGIIDSYKLIERQADGKTDFVEITFSDWFIKAMQGKEVLTLHKDYFRLPSGLVKRLYELVRKHCGYQAHWGIGLDKLHFKSGSQGSLRRFRQAIKDMLKKGNGNDSLDLLEYTMSYDTEKDIVNFYRKPEYLLKELSAGLFPGENIPEDIGE